jgi:hypothetical protein
MTFAGVVRLADAPAQAEDNRFATYGQAKDQ